VQRVQQKISEVTGIPPGHSESFQVHTTYGPLSLLRYLSVSDPLFSDPSTHFSPSLQVLKYDLGQKYNPHMDFSGGAQGTLACGPRILTFFLYLSDVEEGGETAFPHLDIAVKPRKGKALLWPSVHNDDLLKPEQLSLHEARPVLKGRKYAANSWIHLYDYKYVFCPVHAFFPTPATHTAEWWCPSFVFDIFTASPTFTGARGPSTSCKHAVVASIVRLDRILCAFFTSPFK